MESIPPKCKTPNLCLPGIFHSLCSACLVALLEEAAIQSALNFGIPEYCGCGTCGEWLSYNDFLVHPCVINVDK